MKKLSVSLLAALVALTLAACKPATAPADAEAPAEAPSVVESAISGIADAASGAADAVAEAAAPVVEAVSDAASAAVDSAKDAASAASEAAAPVVEAVSDAASSAVDTAKDVASGAVDAVSGFVSSVAGTVEEAVAPAEEAVEEAADAVEEAAEEAAGAAEEAAEEAADAAEEVAEEAAAEAEEAAEAAEEAATGVPPVPVAVPVVPAAGDSAAAPIRMITEATFPPYEFRQGTDVVGIDVEICKAIAAELGRELAVEDVEFDSVLPSLIAGKAELAAAGITVTEDRKMKVDFSVPYVRTGIVYVYAKAAPFEEPESGKGHRIGVQNGTTSADFVREQLGQEPEGFDSPASAFAALKAGKVEVVIADVDPAKNLVKGEPDYDVSDFLTVEEYAVAIAKGQPELLATVNKVIEDLQDSGRLDEIKDEWTAKADALQSSEAAE